MNVARRRFLLVPLALLGAPVRASVEYPDVRRGVPLAFPADEGAHPAFRSEWWYVTGWSRDAEAHEFGFQVTFFRNRPGVAEASTSRFAPKQLLFAHAALADPDRQRLVVDQRAAREGFGLASASEQKTDVRIGDWSLVQEGDSYIARIRARAFALDLTFRAHAPVLLQGDAGVSRKGPDPLDASFYYSRPQLAVSGSVSIGERARAVSGAAWLDHEWSSRYLTRGAVGWDWTGINFDDGGALMAFRIRDARGAPLWAGGTYRDSQGVRRVFAPADIAFRSRATLAIAAHRHRVPGVAARSRRRHRDHAGAAVRRPGARRACRRRHRVLGRRGARDRSTDALRGAATSSSRVTANR